MGTLRKQIKNWTWGKLYRFVFRPWYQLQHYEPVWRSVVNREARSLHLRDQVKLDSLESRIVADLKEKGIARVSVAELFGEGVLAGLQGYVASHRADHRADSFKPYIKNLWDEIPKVDFKNPFVSLALSPRVVAIVNSYLGMRGKLQGLFLTEIDAAPEGSDPAYSQRWHRDPQETRHCKMFIYLSDVGPETGPFTYLEKSNYGNVYGGLFPQRPPAGFYPSSGAVESSVGASEIVPYTAPAGTVIFADTSGLHYGGFVTKGRRVMFTAGFISPKSLHGREISFDPYENDFVQKEYASLSSPSQYALVCNEDSFSRSAYYYLKRTLFSV